MTEQDPIQRLFPDSFIQRLDEDHCVQSELHHTDSLLRAGDRVREWLRDEKENDRETCRRLNTRRDELLERMDRIDTGREERAKAAGGPSALTTRVSTRGPVGGPDLHIGVRYPAGCAPSEGAVPVPVPLEGTSVVPSGGTGAITTIPTSPFDPWEAPEPHYQGVLRTRSASLNLSNWLRNWRYVIPFPCVPCDGTLTYRVYFETGGLFSASFWSASLSNWINVREIGDVSVGIDFSGLPDYEVWPLNQNWPGPDSFMFSDIWGGVTLEGSIGVKRGKAAVLAVIVGVIVGVARGRFQIWTAGFHPWEMQLFPPGHRPPLPPDLPYHAKVHFRYEPSGGVLQQ